ncbi:MAG: tetratricopeptide repeat protein [Labilithrix sp.]|nr:tetratricopeptide repeat protein [Labilithrix sp.]MCW5810170.1 tetratricopeptide repeat protein [Labilithrix sp.]
MRDYFLGDDPSFGLALVPYCFLSMLLFTRHPTRTNFIFDEQEALLANPYVRSVAEANPKFGWLDAFHRDFWGLGPERSIGSYRPIPDLVWRALWGLGARDQTPFLHHWVNVLLHGMNGALVCVLAFALTKRRGVAWIAGATFTGSAVLTEAVSGVVGIADVLGATGTLIALLALTTRLPFMAGGVLVGTLFGLYSKESALCCVPLLPLGAFLLAPLLHPKNPRRTLRALVAFVTAAAAFVFYVYARRWAFPTAIPHELSAEANAAKPFAGRVFAAVLRWYAQPILPKDPLNNPLVNADAIHRIGGALRVWSRGLGQLALPITLSGDYSAPQEPIPPTLLDWEIITGAVLLLSPIPLAIWIAVRSYRRWTRRGDAEPERDPLLIVAFGALWVMLSYFPVSNIPVLLPTVRAERFWYFPAIGSSLVVGVLFGWGADRSKASPDAPPKPRPLWLDVTLALAGLFLLAQLVAVRHSAVDYAFIAPGLVVAGAIVFFAYRRTTVSRSYKWLVFATLAFFLYQGTAARRHANDYTDDLSFWDATRKAVPRSAKAHLNYSVMKGARGDLQTRLDANAIALELAPEWPMASVYYGDTLCRLHRAMEAWPHYVKGFDLAPNDVNLIALGIQCLWDEKVLAEGTAERAELDALKDKHPGSWLEYLGRDILEHGEEHNGVDPKYRPRGYNEGPKE